MNRTMKWFIGCLVTIFIGLAFLLGIYAGLTIHIVDTTIADYHRTNLLILYDVRE